MTETLKVYEYKKHTIEVCQSFDPVDPIQEETLGTIVIWHKRYSLGHEQPEVRPEEWYKELALEFEPSFERWLNWINNEGFIMLEKKYGTDKALKMVEEKIKDRVDKILDKHTVMLPVALLDHSGLWLYEGTGPHYSDPMGWDSGQIGWIYTTIKKAKKWFGWEKITKKRRKIVEEELRKELKTYGAYVSGDVYCFSVFTPSGKLIESVGDWYGDYQEIENDLLKEAKKMIDHYLEDYEEAEVKDITYEYEKQVI